MSSLAVETKHHGRSHQHHQRHKSRRNHQQHRSVHPHHHQQNSFDRNFPSERGLTAQLSHTLKRKGVFDSEEGLRKRKTVVESLEQLLNTWQADVFKRVNAKEPSDSDDDSSKEKDTKPQEPQHRAVLLCFGSYRLQVHQPDADIDALALSPPHCTREEFFSSLVDMLREDERVADLFPVPAAYTPVLKFKMNGVAVDLLFARLSDGRKLEIKKGVEPKSIELDDMDLVGQDEAGVRSINATRVAQVLLRTVPNLENFKLTLRAVKYWAKIRGLYSNVLGFLGGINCAILVAWVCKRHPTALPSTLLGLFFETFASWGWHFPVSLCPVMSTPPPGVLTMPVWDPVSNHRDAMRLMTILTPAYPTMNSSYNVELPQLRRIYSEFCEAANTASDIMNGKAKWKDLFRPNDFFHQHQHFLQVRISAPNGEDFRSWFGLCESKLRVLIIGLEAPERGIQSFPYATIFHHTHDNSENPEECLREASFFIAFRIALGVENVELRFCINEFLHKVNFWEGRRLGMDLMIEHVKQENLPSFVFPDKAKLPRVEKAKVVNSESSKEATSSERSTQKPPKGPSKAPLQSLRPVENRGERPPHSPVSSTNPSPAKRAKKKTISGAGD